MDNINVVEIVAEDSLKYIVKNSRHRRTLELIERVYAKNQKAKSFLIKIFNERILKNAL